MHAANRNLRGEVLYASHVGQLELAAAMRWHIDKQAPLPGGTNSTAPANLLRQSLAWMVWFLLEPHLSDMSTALVPGREQARWHPNFVFLSR